MDKSMRDSHFRWVSVRQKDIHVQGHSLSLKKEVTTRNQWHFIIPSLVICFALFSCTAPKQEMDVAQLRQIIEDINTKFMDAVNQGDAASIASLYSEDATLLPPGGTLIQGKQGVQEYWDAVFQMGLKKAVLTTVSVYGSGNLAYEIGKVNLIIQPEEGESIEQSGKYLVVWKKDIEDSWKLHVDIWNSSQ